MCVCVCVCACVCVCVCVCVCEVQSSGHKVLRSGPASAQVSNATIHYHHRPDQDQHNTMEQSLQLRQGLLWFLRKMVCPYASCSDCCSVVLFLIWSVVVVVVVADFGITYIETF